MDNATKTLLRRILSWTVALLGLMAAAGISVVSLMHFLNLTVYSVSGSSMEPTLQNNNVLLLKKEATPQKGQIIFIPELKSWLTPTPFTPENTLIVKRIAALPGDTISYDGVKLTVNGSVIYNFADGDYSCNPKIRDYSHKLTKDELFVMGDNSHHSLDSRRIFCDGRSDFYLPLATAEAYGNVIAKF